MICFPAQARVVLAAMLLAASDGTSQATKPDTESQRAICQAVADHWKQQDATYVLSALVVQGDWAIFDGIPASVANAPDENSRVLAGKKLKSGTDYIAAVLNKKKGKWIVAKSWPHGDIPDPSEFKSRQTKGLPETLVTSFFTALRKG